GAAARQLPVFVIGLRDLLAFGIGLGPDAFAEDIGGEGDVAHLGQHLAALFDVVAEAAPFMGDENARPFALLALVVCPKTFAGRGLVQIVVIVTFDHAALPLVGALM